MGPSLPGSVGFDIPDSQQLLRRPFRAEQASLDPWRTPVQDQDRTDIIDGGVIHVGVDDGIRNHASKAERVAGRASSYLIVDDNVNGASTDDVGAVSVLNRGWPMAETRLPF